jgi:transposase
VQRFCVNAPDCSRVVEQLPWLAKHARETRRLAKSGARLCQIASIKHAAKFYGLSRNTVKRMAYGFRDDDCFFLKV